MSPIDNPLLGILVGCLLGTLTGLIPGLHVNTLAAASLLLPGHWNVPLLAAGTAHTVVNIIPATQFGGGDDADAGLALPARQLALEGRLQETVRTSVTASTLAGIAAWQIGRLLEAHWQPALDFIAEHRLLVLLVFLLWSIGPLLRTANAWGVMLMAAALGFLSQQLPLTGPVGNQALLPLLTGLFAVPVLLDRAEAAPPGAKRPVRWRHVRQGLLDAIPLATLTSMLPGITSGVASRMTRNRGNMHHVAKISALNTTHAVLALHIVAATGVTRTGLAEHTTPILWASVPIALGAGGLAAILLANVKLPAMGLPVLGLLGGLTWMLTGLPGIMLWITASLLGIHCRKQAVSPVLLTACLWLPLLQT